MIIAAKLSEEQFRNFIQSMFIVCLFAFYITSLILWFSSSNLNFQGRVYSLDNNKMLVLITTLYAFFTYLILRSNKENFDISRLSIITISNYDSNFLFRFNNIGQYLAKNIICKINIIYPLPKKIKDKLIYHFKTKMQRMEFRIPEIMPDNSADIDIEKDILKRVPLKINRDYMGAYKSRFISKKPISFEVHVSFIYETDTSYQIPDEIKEIFY